ncbi:unnamed protein product [Amoebophrya sp. A120]|nr:unnamed protein product [Amoebophrya sp. A120]|eukprot:GSA120T00007014001.1
MFTDGLALLDHERAAAKLPKQLPKDPIGEAAGRQCNFYNGVRVDFPKWSSESDNTRAAALVPASFRDQYPLDDATVFLVWPEEKWYPPKTLAQRNAFWRLWSHYCLTQNHKDWLLDIRTVTTTKQVQDIQNAHPDIKFSDVLDFADYLVQHGYKDVKACVSLVCQRLRSLHGLERKQPWRQQCQSQTYETLKRMQRQYTRTRACPPSFPETAKLSVRHQKIFVMWWTSGLRPISFESISGQKALPSSKIPGHVMAHARDVKVDESPGELNMVHLPAGIFFPDVLPASRSDLEHIAATLKTNPYGIRRGLAIALRLRSMMLGYLPGGTPQQRAQYAAYKEKVNSWFLWSPNSTEWERDYSVDAELYLRHRFDLHPATQAHFTVEDHDIHQRHYKPIHRPLQNESEARMVSQTHAASGTDVVSFFSLYNASGSEVSH